MNNIQKISNASDSVEFEYLIAGDGKPSIVFLNGYRMHFKSWDKVYKTLAAQNSVFLYNRLGIRKSSKPNEPQNGLIAELAFIHFLLVPASRSSSVMEDKTLELLPNLSMLILGLLAFVLIRKLIHYLHKKKHGVLHSKLESLWHL